VTLNYPRVLGAMKTWAYKARDLSVKRLVDYAGFTSSPEEERAVWSAEVGALEQAHIFEFPEHVGTLLTLTDNEPHPIKLPFPVIYLDVEFQVRTQKVVNNYIGILLCQKEGEDEATAYAYTDTHYEVSGTEDEMVEFRSSGVSEQGQTIIDVRYPVGPVTFDRLKARVNIKPETRGGAELQDSVRYARTEFKTLNNLTLNFLDLLETPDVFLVHMNRRRANERRERHGQIPLPDHSIVRVRDSLRRYIYELESGGAFQYSHAFWVRGHWMHFRSDRYIHVQGERTWVRPYTKGQGILVQGVYEMPGVRS
jgi:hypothetical protein